MDGIIDLFRLVKPDPRNPPNPPQPAKNWVGLDLEPGGKIRYITVF